MKKYKLIKEYPGSFKLGTVLTYDSGYYSIPDVSNTSIRRELVENHPEYWEKYKDFEILAFRGNTNTDLKGVLSKESAHLMLNNTGTLESLEITMLDSGYEIYSAKRITDGEVFTVGDRVKQSNASHNTIFNITGFKFDVNNEHLLALGGNGGIKLKKIEHLKPLFKTEDGVDIFEGDIVHQVDEKFMYHSYRWGAQNVIGGKPFPEFKMFSTKEKADEYVLENKPLNINFKKLMSILNECATYIIDENKLKEKLCNL